MKGKRDKAKILDRDSHTHTPTHTHTHRRTDTERHRDTHAPTSVHFQRGFPGSAPKLVQGRHQGGKNPQPRGFGPAFCRYLPPYDMVGCAEGVGKKIMLRGRQKRYQFSLFISLEGVLHRRLICSPCVLRSRGIVLIGLILVSKFASRARRVLKELACCCLCGVGCCLVRNKGSVRTCLTGCTSHALGRGCTSVECSLGRTLKRGKGRCQLEARVQLSSTSDG